MKNLLVIFLLLFSSLLLHSQEDSSNHGTIKVVKTGQLKKVQFDNVNYRLIGIDQYGNILDSAVVEFDMSVTIKGIFYHETTVGPGLSYQMQQLLGRCDRTSKIIFENITAKDRKGTLMKMPSFRYNFGYSEENNE